MPLPASVASRLREVIPITLLSSGEAIHGVLCPVLGSSVQEKQAHVVERATKYHRDDYGGLSTSYLRRAGRAEAG